MLLRTSGLEDTGGGDFSEHWRYEEESVWCRSGTQVIKIEGKAHIKSSSRSKLGRKKAALRLFIEAESGRKYRTGNPLP